MEIASFIADQLQGLCYDDGRCYWYRPTVDSNWREGRTRYSAIRGPVEQMRHILPADPYWDRGRRRLQTLAYIYQLIALASHWLPRFRPE